MLLHGGKEGFRALRGVDGRITRPAKQLPDFNSDHPAPGVHKSAVILCCKTSFGSASVQLIRVPMPSGQLEGTALLLP